MNRRRILWLGVPLVTIGIAIAASLVLARRDADFVVVGPMTIGTRNNFAKLDVMIDPAEFRDCKTVRDAVARFNKVLQPREPANEGPAPIPARMNHDWLLRLDGAAFIALDLPFQRSKAAGPIPVKQFLREAFAQPGLPKVIFIVRGHCIEVTTLECAQEERARYLDSVGVFDRMRNLWKGITGELKADQPDVLSSHW